MIWNNNSLKFRPIFCPKLGEDQRKKKKEKKKKVFTEIQSHFWLKIRWRPKKKKKKKRKKKVFTEIKSH